MSSLSKFPATCLDIFFLSFKYVTPDELSIMSFCAAVFGKYYTDVFLEKKCSLLSICIQGGTIKCGISKAEVIWSLNI